MDKVDEISALEKPDDQTRLTMNEFSIDGRLLAVNPDGKIRRPTNSFLLFARDHRRKVANEHPGLNNGEVSTLLGSMWHELDPERKDSYRSKASLISKVHKKLYPDYVYNPMEARMLKKARREKKQCRSYIHMNAENSEAKNGACAHASTSCNHQKEMFNPGSSKGSPENYQYSDLIITSVANDSSTSSQTFLDGHVSTSSSPNPSTANSGSQTSGCNLAVSLQNVLGSSASTQTTETLRGEQPPPQYTDTSMPPQKMSNSQVVENVQQPRDIRQYDVAAHAIPRGMCLCTRTFVPPFTYVCPNGLPSCYPHHVVPEASSYIGRPYVAAPIYNTPFPPVQHTMSMSSIGIQQASQNYGNCILPLNYPNPNFLYSSPSTIELRQVSASTHPLFTIIPPATNVEKPAAASSSDQNAEVNGNNVVSLDKSTQHENNDLSLEESVLVIDIDENNNEIREGNF